MVLTGLAIAGLASGLLSTGYGAYKEHKAVKEREQAQADHRARNEAWYRRNYYEDYLNTVGAQNAMKAYREAWEERTREARARQAITGGTPEQAQAVAEAGGEAMGNLVSNLAAQGADNKRRADEIKLQMDADMYKQDVADAEAKMAAGATLRENGMSLVSNSLQAFGSSGGTRSTGGTTSDGGLVTPPSKTINGRAAVGKENGMNPALWGDSGDSFYSKNRKQW